MGVCKSKPVEPKKSLLSERKRDSLAAAFRLNGKESLPTLTKYFVREVWQDTLTEYLMNLFLEYLFKTQDTIELVDLESFYYNMVEGSTQDRAIIIMSMLGTDKTIDPDTLREYIINLVESYINILRKNNDHAYNSWRHGDDVYKSDLNILADYCMKGISYSDNGKMEMIELERWLIVCSFSREVFESVLHFLCNTDVVDLKPTLPVADGQSSLLRIPLVLMLSHLTRCYAKRAWRLLYDSWTDPHSWVILQMRLINQGPNIVVIEETGGFVFGGFASQSWKICTGFFGDDRCFLFRLRPDMLISTASTSNKRYQYLFDGQGMFPKGLAFGGVLNYFGLYLSPDFGPGQVSETCDTYDDYVPLCKQRHFYFSRLEVWGIADAEPRLPIERKEHIAFDPYLMEAKRFLANPGSEHLNSSFQESEKWNFL